jgi:hypothetical protein
MCRDVARDQRWEVVSVSPDRVIARQGTRPGSWPVTIVFDLEDSEPGTRVHIEARVFGWGTATRACRLAVEGARDALVWEDSRREAEGNLGA